MNTSFRLLWWRKRRGLREKRFVEAHRDNIYAWRKRWEEWPEMATSGPWAGIAEDLTQTSLKRELLSGEQKQALTWVCHANGLQRVSHCAIAVCGPEHGCMRDGRNNLT
jgi:hypothetical protein